MTETTFFENDTGFPDDMDDSGDNDFSNAIPWREVRMGTWLCIADTIMINTSKYGKKSMIARLQERDGSFIKAWMTSLIAENVTAIEEKMKSEQHHGKKLFIMSVGKKTCRDGIMNYYDFRIKLIGSKNEVE